MKLKVSLKKAPRVLRHESMIHARYMQERYWHNYLKNGQNWTLVRYGTSSLASVVLNRGKWRGVACSYRGGEFCLFAFFFLFQTRSQK